MKKRCLATPLQIKDIFCTYFKIMDIQLLLLKYTRYFIKVLEFIHMQWYYDYVKRVPTPKWMPHKSKQLSLRATPILWVRQDRHFYFRFFLFWRKVSNATTNIPVATIKEATAKIVETISKAVITPPPFLCIPACRLHKLGRLPPCHGYSLQDYCIICLYPLQDYSLVFFNLRKTNLYLQLS